MSVTLKQVEAIPATYPAVTGLSVAAVALDPAMIWQRIESYIAYRWTARAVVWTVEGSGEWTAPLTPATLTTVEVWDGAAWVEAFPVASPLGGYDLAACGPYRITATVGSGTPPAAVLEAFRRLAEYSVEVRKDGMVSGHPSHTSHSTDIGDAIKESYTRSANWTARAMQLSGAADLLRPYRRAQ